MSFELAIGERNHCARSLAMNGILLALQFFTVLPIHKEIPLNRKEVTMMYCALPFIGGAIGLTMYGVYEIAANILQFGPLLTAVLVVLTWIGLTGGLHVDGWADTADAFFSYRTREKRLGILEDPRLGAFGAMALVLLMIMKIALIHEVILQDMGAVYLFMMIPFLARAGLNICFSTLRPAKSTGIAHFFREKLAPTVVIVVTVFSSMLILFAYYYGTNQWLPPVILAGSIAAAIFLFRRWAMKHFHGMTGDLAGAFIEGMEALLWLIVLCLL
ncbi:cobalamin 5'-phosphate synthase [Sporosarcina ureilytica]|uniref:Adenosylcobinamide-GDP ribazoletransferase n=2 Tax=Sporosarcina ureilytica TaxID=298596 RepID=A0A1D8JJI1_9BACL|nr:cobalamin 5'-phosphate synthase [Sporosarcina ureilytica]